MNRNNDQPVSTLLWDTEIESLLVAARERTTQHCTPIEQVHRYYEMVFNFSAVHLRHTAAERAYTSDTPFILFRAPYLLHSTALLEKAPYHRYNLVFHPNIFTEFGGICKLGKLERHWECFIPTTTAQIEALEPLLQRIVRADDPTVPKNLWIGTLSALLCEVNELADQAIPHDSGITAPPYMQDLLRYVVEHIAEPLTLDMLAEKFFISRAKLTRDFRTAVTTSLHDYITSIRVQRAKILLDEGVPLAIITQQCGFSQETAFIHMFKKRTGMTPGEYRQSVHAKRD